MKIKTCPYARRLLSVSPAGKADNTDLLYRFIGVCTHQKDTLLTLSAKVGGVSTLFYLTSFFSSPLETSKLYDYEYIVCSEIIGSRSLQTLEPNLMKIPYDYDYNGDSNQKTVLQRLPVRFTYPPKAVPEPNYFIWHDAEIVSQQLNNKPFLFDLAEFRIKKDCIIPFKPHDRNVFLYFMPESEDAIYSSDHEGLMHINYLLPKWIYVNVKR